MDSQKKYSDFDCTKRWKELCQPSVFRYVLHIILHAIYYGMQLLDAIFAANAVTGIASQNWRYAYLSIIFLALGVIVRNIVCHICALNKAKMYARVNSNVSAKLYHKLIYANSSNLEKASKEYILNTIGTNLDGMSTFQHDVAARIGRIVKLVIALTVIFTANIYAALIVLVLAFIDYFALRWLNSLGAKANRMVYSARDKMYEEVTRMLTGHSIISEFEREKQYEKRYAQKVKDFNNAMTYKYKTASYKDDFFYVFYRVIICAINLLFIMLVSQNALTLAVYLIAVSYVLDSTELFNNVFDINQVLTNLQVHVNRVDTIMKFTDEELVKYGSIVNKSGGDNISLVGVSYRMSDRASQYSGELVDVDISFARNAVNVVKGSRRCGKRLIFNMLRRNIKPDKGMVVYDSVDLFNYSHKDYKRKIYYAVREPQFIVGTIYENLAISGCSKTKIYDMCKRVGIHDQIMALRNKYDTAISGQVPRLLRFYIGLVRSLLTNCETLMIYETPSAMSISDKNNLLKVFENLSRDHTIIIFTYGTLFDSIAKLNYEIEDGQVVSVKAN